MLAAFFRSSAFAGVTNITSLAMQGLGRPLPTIALALLGALLCCHSARAQTTFGSITGVVTDPTGAVIQGTLGQSNSIGILVQRVVATKKVHGTRTLVVRNVGRVPLGRHHKGKVTIHWNLKVNGHRLRPGRYLITLRALDRHGNVLGVTKSVVFRVTH